MCPSSRWRTPPGHCGRGRTASRGGEPEVRGGAPGNPSPSEPGGAGAGGQEVRAEGAERAEPAGEEEDGEGGPAPASRSPLLAAAEPAHFAFRLWTAAGLREPGTPQPCPRRLG